MTTDHQAMATLNITVNIPLTLDVGIHSIIILLMRIKKWCNKSVECKVQTCDGCEQGCDISLACSEGVVCGWGEAPRVGWERRGSMEGRYSDLTWAVAKDAAFLGLGCLPSTHGGKQWWFTKEGRQKGRINKNRLTNKSYSKREATGLLCLGLHCTHCLDGNVALLLQIREEQTDMTEIQKTTDMNMWCFANANNNLLLWYHFPLADVLEQFVCQNEGQHVHWSSCWSKRTLYWFPKQTFQIPSLKKASETISARYCF